jgi:hypothetical protein
MTSLAWLLAAAVLNADPIQQPSAAEPRPPEAAPATTAPKPSAEHDRLDALAGTWRFERTFSPPGRPVERTTGFMESRWILDNRYLECRTREGEGASASESLLIYGFDTARRVYFSLAIGSRGTNYRNLEGFYDEAARSFVLLGKDPGDGRTPGSKLRQTVRVENRDRHVLELFVVNPGRLPQKVVEIAFARQ